MNNAESPKRGERGETSGGTIRGGDGGQVRHSFLR